MLERDPGGLSGFRARLLAGYREQAQKIAVGVQALLDRALEENASMLIEGANLLTGTFDLDRYRDRFAMPEGAVSILRVTGGRDVQLIAHGITDDLLVSAEH